MVSPRPPLFLQTCAIPHSLTVNIRPPHPVPLLLFRLSSLPLPLSGQRLEMDSDQRLEPRSAIGHISIQHEKYKMRKKEKEEEEAEAKEVAHLDRFHHVGLRALLGYHLYLRSELCHDRSAGSITHPLERTFCRSLWHFPFLPLGRPFLLHSHRSKQRRE